MSADIGLTNTHPSASGASSAGAAACPVATRGYLVTQDSLETGTGNGVLCRESSFSDSLEESSASESLFCVNGSVSDIRSPDTGNEFSDSLEESSSDSDLTEYVDSDTGSFYSVHSNLTARGGDSSFSLEDTEYLSETTLYNSAQSVHGAFTSSASSFRSFDTPRSDLSLASAPGYRNSFCAHASQRRSLEARSVSESSWEYASCPDLLHTQLSLTSPPPDRNRKPFVASASCANHLGGRRAARLSQGRPSALSSDSMSTIDGASSPRMGEDGDKKKKGLMSSFRKSRKTSRKLRLQKKAGDTDSISSSVSAVTSDGEPEIGDSEASAPNSPLPVKNDLIKAAKDDDQQQDAVDNMDSHQATHERLNGSSSPKGSAASSMNSSPAVSKKLKAADEKEEKKKEKSKFGFLSRKENKKQKAEQKAPAESEALLVSTDPDTTSQSSSIKEEKDDGNDEAVDAVAPNSSAEALEKAGEPSAEAPEKAGEPSAEALEEAGEPSAEAPEKAGEPSAEPSAEAPEKAGEPSAEAPEKAGEPSAEAPEKSGEPSAAPPAVPSAAPPAAPSAAPVAASSPLAETPSLSFRSYISSVQFVKNWTGSGDSKRSVDVPDSKDAKPAKPAVAEENDAKKTTSPKSPTNEVTSKRRTTVTIVSKQKESPQPRHSPRSTKRVRAVASTPSLSSASSSSKVTFKAASKGNPAAKGSSGFRSHISMLHKVPPANALSSSASDPLLSATKRSVQSPKQDKPPPLPPPLTVTPPEEDVGRSADSPGAEATTPPSSPEGQVRDARETPEGDRADADQQQRLLESSGQTAESWAGASTDKREHLYKILVIGELGTGKTSIIKRYVHQFFSQHYRATIGVDFALKVLNWDSNTVIRLQLWDIAGQERFGNMTRVYYKEAVGAFVVFDVTRAQTFDAVTKWKTDLDTKVTLADGSPIPAVLLANKCDQPKEGVVNNPARMDDYCRERGFSGWFETSAKENINIDEASRFLVNKILSNEKQGMMMTESLDTDKFSIDGKANPAEKAACRC